MDHMNARRFARVSPAIALLLVAGCKSQPAASSTNPKPDSVAFSPTTAPSNDLANTDSTAPLSDALTQKTAAYAQSLESTDVPAQTSTPPFPPAAPTSVQWSKPRRPKFLDPPADNSVPANAPLAQLTTPADNTARPASTTMNPTDSAHVKAITQLTQSNSLNDVPAIVPESQDLPQAQPAASVDDLENRITKRMRDNPRDVASQLDYQLYQLLEDQPSPQLASISSLPSEDREVVSALVDGVSNFRTAVRQDNNMLLSKKIRPIIDMADRVRTEAELAVPTVALCSKVDGFGKYEPMDPRFPAGRENPVIVYCEIENFQSTLDDKRMWVTNLSQEVTLFTETGMLAWKDKSRPVTDECRNRRHDFFLYDVIKLPANLSIGRYLLKVTIVDKTANRVAESTVPVEMDAEGNAE
jgi:hypothetical protein